MPFVLSVRHEKILAAILGCIDLGCLPSDEGLLDVLHGVSPFPDHPLQGGLRSLSSRNLKAQLRQLERAGYLLRHEQEEESFLYLSIEGNEVARAYLDKPHKPFAPVKRGKPKYLPIERKES